MSDFLNASYELCVQCLTEAYRRILLSLRDSAVPSKIKDILDFKSELHVICYTIPRHISYLHRS